MANKAKSYGIKIFILTDCETGFFLDGSVYLRLPEANQGMRVVQQLCHPLYNSGRNITMDRFFMSIPLAQSLSRNGLTCLGTLAKNKPHVPADFTARGRQLHSTMFGYNEDMQLSSYVARPTKCVLILSTMHSTNHINSDEESKPDAIVDYNLTKWGVDRLDQMANTYTCRRKTRRWPNVLFFNILYMCAINAYMTHTWLHPTWPGTTFHLMDKRSSCNPRINSSKLVGQFDCACPATCAIHAAVSGQSVVHAIAAPAMTMEDWCVISATIRM